METFYLIISLVLTANLSACNTSASQNQVTTDVSPSAENVSPGDTTETENVTDNPTENATTSSSDYKTKTTAKSGTSNKTKTTANSSTSNKKGSANPCGKQITFATEETPNYRVYICATQSSVTNYVGISKKDGKSIKLPVKVDEKGNFTATNGNTTYTLHKTGSLTVVERDKKTGIGVAVVNENGKIKPDSGSPAQTNEDTQSETTQTSQDIQPETTRPPVDTSSETTQPPADTSLETTQHSADTPSE